MNPNPRITILAPGPLATIQDRGRTGYGALGVGRSGAADRGAAALANRLVGNLPDAAVIETTAGGTSFVCDRLILLAVTGADTSVVIAAPGGRTRQSGINAAIAASAGATVTLAGPAAGLRNYIAIRGGIAVAPVLGSRSRDVLAEVGPEPLRSGDELPIGDESAAWPATDLAPRARLSTEPILAVIPGPRTRLFERGALATLCSAPYSVTAAANRIGLRLEGPPLRRNDSAPAELPSEAMMPGALQVPPSGQPTLFLADHPVTGGYPVLATIVSPDIDRAAQLRPGERVRFTIAVDRGWGAP